MLFDPEYVLGFADRIEPAADATAAHAQAVTAIGFEAGHAGQAYSEQGAKLADGLDGIVTMLRDWSATSSATAAALRTAVTAMTGVDDRFRGRLDGLNSGQ
ncbi:hypothetical protein [Nocardia stercoris]|uniref:ESX-1 secretion-associated protein n=1 Tax=Nocardia stercoris TaxID=2483361 RepID=A0A3M2LEI0_9NOCA|nr:hypothetical protein [Nocardia stercoris]RMI35180.1 hypothetical protein EBN03_02440 [Nocardia stercoris]